jgi:hypothetical protein
MWRAGAVYEDMAICNIVEGGQQAIDRAVIPCMWGRSRRIDRAAILYIESSSCRKRTWLSVRLERGSSRLYRGQDRIWRAGAVEEDLANSNIVEGEHQAIGRAAWCIWRAGAAERGLVC